MRILPLALSLALATPLVAQEMTDEERTAFRAEIRTYLLENPEVLMEAIGVLEARQQAEAVAADVAMAQANANLQTRLPGSRRIDHGRWKYPLHYQRIPNPW